MNLKKIYNKLFCIMQWNIGIARGDIGQIIREKKCSLLFKWMPLTDDSKSIADPFIFKDHEGNLYMLYEDFSMIEKSKYGKIILAIIDNNFNVINSKELLNTNSHCSYPFIFYDGGKTYIIPETSVQSKLTAYEYDFINRSLINQKVLINDLPLLDATLLKYNNKYWLFATKSGKRTGSSALYIYYSDNLFGKFLPHPNNPVKNNEDGSRSAGRFIEVDGAIYRPAQNCSQHYGASLSINKVTDLTEKTFSEELYFKIMPDKNSKFNSGVHTINVVDDIIVIDGIRMVFNPLKKLLLFLKK